MNKRSIKKERKNEKYTEVAERVIVIDTDTTGNRFPKVSDLSNLLATNLGTPKSFRIDGRKKDETHYEVRIYSRGSTK